MIHPINPQIGISKVEKALAGWPNDGRLLLTLWDMIELNVGSLLGDVTALESWANKLQALQHNGRPWNAPYGEKEQLTKTVEDVVIASSKAGIDGLIWLGENVNHAVVMGREPGAIADNISSFLTAVMLGMEARKFLYMPGADAGNFEVKNLFGDEVSVAFPSAVDEIRASGTSLAVGLPHAAVFHLMRVMEYGLNLLHNSLIPTPPSSPNWKNIIEGIEKHIREIDQGKVPKPNGWHGDKSFYIDSARHFFFFKDRRNKSIHIDIRIQDYAPPSREQAMAIFDQVKSFMQHLATKLKE